MSDVMLKAEKLVEKKKWEKLKNKFLYGSDEARLALAAACGASDTDEACNILISLLHSTVSFGETHIGFLAQL